MSARPDPALDVIGLEVHAALPQVAAPSEVAATFARAGWSLRKSAWDEYEVAQSWAELRVFAGHGWSLLAGAVLPDRIDELAGVLRELGLHCTVEVYDQQGDLVRTVDTGG
jgi:hypothetical protein